MTRGFLLLEAVIALFLVFLGGMTMATSFHQSNQAYSQATQIRVALRLAREGLELVRSGSLKPVQGVQNLPTLDQQLGHSKLRYSPEIEFQVSSPVTLVRSRVRWFDGRRNHAVELTTYVAT